LVLGVKPEEGINDFCSRSGAPRRVLTALEAGLGFIKKYDFFWYQVSELFSN
jgi:hypothetical protein